MTGSDTLAKALADVRQRRSDLQTQYERIGAELSKLQMAEASLAAIVEGTPLDEAAFSSGDPTRGLEIVNARSGRNGKRGARGPRANSAKGRLRVLLNEAGPQGLTHAEITRRLPDVSPATLNAYLSGMVSSGEFVRSGDFFKPSYSGVATDNDDADDITSNHDGMEDEAAE